MSHPLQLKRAGTTAPKRMPRRHPDPQEPGRRVSPDPGGLRRIHESTAAEEVPGRGGQRARGARGEGGEERGAGGRVREGLEEEGEAGQEKEGQEKSWEVVARANYGGR